VGFAYSQDVSSHYGGAVGWREEGAFGNQNVNGLQTALVKWDVLRDEATKTVDNRRVGDGFGGVGIS